MAWHCISSHSATRTSSPPTSPLSFAPVQIPPVLLHLMGWRAELMCNWVIPNKGMEDLILNKSSFFTSPTPYQIYFFPNGFIQKTTLKAQMSTRKGQWWYPRHPLWAVKVIFIRNGQTSVCLFHPFGRTGQMNLTATPYWKVMAFHSLFQNFSTSAVENPIWWLMQKSYKEWVEKCFLALLVEGWLQ